MTAAGLAEALAALVAVATQAGLDPAAARAEGEALSATVAERSKGAFVDWSEQTGRPASAEEFMLAAKRGNRFRVGPTPLMGQLSLERSATAPDYARALGEVAMAATLLGRAAPEAVGTAAMAAAAQLGEPTFAGAGGGAFDLPARQDVTGEPVDRLAGQPAEELAGGPVEQTSPATPTRSVEELLAELDGLIGLENVKGEIHRQAAVLRVEGLRKKAGLESPTITRHLVFNGNPGTGKTTVARLVAGIYRALGLLSKGQLVEVDRSELVAGYLGQTAQKTSDVVRSAEGGVLFIDEAYSLSGDQYGREAIDTLVKEMEVKRNDLVVIVAGYPVPMMVFISENPGLESRFRTTIDFPDYTDEELAEIFAQMTSAADYDASEEVLARLREVLAQQERGPSFGNARFVRNLLEAAIGRLAWRLRDVAEPTIEQLRELHPEDLVADPNEPVPEVPPQTEEQP